MEKKKLLLVTISVGLFLVLTIGAALLVFTPKSSSLGAFAVQTSQHSTPISYQPPAREAAPLNPQPSTLDAVDLLRSPEDVPGLQTPPERVLEENFLYPGGNSKSNETLISVAKPNAAAVPDTVPAKTTAPSSQAPPKPTQTATPIQTAKPVQTTTPAKTTTTTPVAAAAPAPVSSQAASSTSQPKLAVSVYDDYWVQTGAFSSPVRAEGVKATLASKGIISIIENREISGQTLFRVRVGPYTSQNEANYWLSLIKSIDGFEDSQVRQTRR
jgi:DedD protein